MYIQSHIAEVIREHETEHSRQKRTVVDPKWNWHAPRKMPALLEPEGGK